MKYHIAVIADDKSDKKYYPLTSLLNCEPSEVRWEYLMTHTIRCLLDSRFPLPTYKKEREEFITKLLHNGN